MESVPIVKRTRLQRAIKDKELGEEIKRRWFAARSNWRNRMKIDANFGVVNDDKDDNVKEVVKVKVEYALDSHNGNPIKQNLVHIDCDHGFEEEDCGILKDDRDGDGSDDSLQIIGEKWNPDHCYDSDSGGETKNTCRGIKVSGFTSSSIGDDGKEIYEKDDGDIGVCNDADLDGGNANDYRLKTNSKDSRNRKNGEKVSSAGLFRRCDGLVSPEESDNDSQGNDFVGRRTRSNFKTRLLRKKRRDETSGRYVTIDHRSSSSADGNEDGDKRGENVVKRKRGRPCKNNNVTHECKTLNDMLKKILENEDAGSDIIVCSDSSPDSDDETRNICRETKVYVFRSSFIGEDGNEINVKDDNHFCVCNDAKVDGGNASKNKRERVPNSASFHRFEGLVLSKELNNNFQENNFVGSRTRSNLKKRLSLKNRGGETFSHHVAAVDEFSSSLAGNKYDDKRGENVGKRKIGRSRKNSNAKSGRMTTNEAENDMLNTILENENAGVETVVSYANEPVQNSLPEKSTEKEEREGLFSAKSGRMKTSEAENNMLNTISENENVGVETVVSYASESSLPLKFNFPVQNSLPGKSAEEDEREGLFSALDFALRACDDAGCSISGSVKKTTMFFHMKVRLYKQSCAVKESTI